MKRDFSAKVKKKKYNSTPAPKPAKTQPHSCSSALGITRILFFFPPSQQNVKNVLNEKFSSYK